MDDTGRPEYTEEQYQKWFDELAPFFKLGETLNAAIEDTGLQKHRTTLYEKVRLNDWFSYKMETLQAIPGKLANNILVKRLMLVDEKIKQGLQVSEEEMKDVRFIAEKHRSSQPYFVNRHEVAETPPYDPVKIQYVLDQLDVSGDFESYRDLPEKVKEELSKIKPGPGGTIDNVAVMAAYSLEKMEDQIPASP